MPRLTKLLLVDNDDGAVDYHLPPFLKKAVSNCSFFGLLCEGQESPIIVSSWHSFSDCALQVMWSEVACSGYRSMAKIDLCDAELVPNGLLPWFLLQFCSLKLSGVLGF